MPKFSENFPLLKLNTFHINVYCAYFTEINSVDELREIQDHRTYKDNARMILGGGSNVLFRSDYNGLVIKNNIKGIELVGEDEKHLYVKSGG